MFKDMIKSPALQGFFIKQVNIQNSFIAFLLQNNTKHNKNWFLQPKECRKRFHAI